MDESSKRTAEKLEQAGRGSKETKYVLRLYVAGMTPRSRRAIENIRKICEEELKGRYEIEIIDVYQQPELAEKMNVIAAPTLVRELPLPLRRVIGDLSDKKKVVVGLDLRTKEEK